MMVVTQLNPGGSSRRYGSDTSRRKARSPELRSGIWTRRQRAGDLADDPLRRHPGPLVGAFLGGAGADDLIDIRVVIQIADEFRDALVGIGHVGVGPDDDLTARLGGADPPGRARAAVAPEGHQPHRREVARGLAQHGERGVRRLVVDDEQLVGVAAGDHRGVDALELFEHVVLLVVAGQHDGDVGGVGGDRLRLVARARGSPRGWRRRSRS